MYMRISEEEIILWVGEEWWQKNKNGVNRFGWIDDMTIDMTEDQALNTDYIDGFLLWDEMKEENQLPKEESRLEHCRVGHEDYISVYGA